MKILLAALLALLGSAPCLAATPNEALATRQFLIGTWNCTFTVAPTDGSAPVQQGPYTTTWANALDGTWLRQTYDQPSGPKEEPFRAEYFIGYDQARQSWIRFGVSSTGMYFAIRMTEDGNGGWTWKYVGLFPRKTATPPSDTPDASFTRVSDTEYRIEGPTYPDGGVQVAEHHNCKKT